MKLIDADDLMTWLGKFHIQSTKEAEEHPDRDRRMYCEGHAHLSKELAAMIQAGEFDPPVPEVPKFKAGQLVRHKKGACHEGIVIGYSPSGKRVRIKIGGHWNVYYAPEALELIEEDSP